MTKFINKHLGSQMGEKVPGKTRDQFLQDALKEYHEPGCSRDRKKEICTDVMREMFHLCVNATAGKCAPNVPVDEILAIMMANIMKAMENYQPSMETKFTAFLSNYLKNAVATAYRESFIIRNPAKPRSFTIQKLYDKVDGVTPAEERLMKRLAPPVMLLEDVVPMCEPTENTELPCLGTTNIDALEYMLTGEKVHLLGHILSHEHTLLSDKEKLVIKHRYGVFGHEKLTGEKVADQFKTRGWPASKEWVCQLEKRALSKIKKHFATHRLG